MTNRPTLTALILLLIALPASGEPPPGIHVSGRGTLEVAPDMGYVSLHARREGEDATTLKAELDEVVREVLRLAGRLDVAERDVTATAVSITPRYRRRADETVVDGLIATRSISITLRDLGAFGDLLNGALTLGINNVDPIRLDTSQREQLEDEALALAMEDARREAGRVAAGFTVNLGAVSDVQVGMHAPRPVEAARGAMALMADGGSDFSPGVIRIERSLEATFAILGTAESR